MAVLGDDKKRKLGAFTRGQISDALNLLQIMRREAISEADLIDTYKSMDRDILITKENRKSVRGFMRRTTKAERDELRKTRGLIRRRCQSCEERRENRKNYNKETIVT